MAATKKIEENERAYANIAKMLDETEAVSTKAMNNALNELSEKEKFIQEQENSQKKTRSRVLLMH